MFIPKTENGIVEYVDAKSAFEAKEIVTLLENIANCIEEGSNPGYFSQVIDKLIGNTMQPRTEQLELDWQKTYDNVD